MAWTPPTGSMWQDSGCCRSEREVPMDEVGIIGLDLAGNVFQVHGARPDGSVAFRRKPTRAKLLPFFASRRTQPSTDRPRTTPDATSSAYRSSSIPISASRDRLCSPSSGAGVRIAPEAREVEDAHSVQGAATLGFVIALVKFRRGHVSVHLRQRPDRVVRRGRRRRARWRGTVRRSSGHRPRRHRHPSPRHPPPPPGSSGPSRSRPGAA